MSVKYTGFIFLIDIDPFVIFVNITAVLTNMIVILANISEYQNWS